jgi:hypothetical protein
MPTILPLVILLLSRVHAAGSKARLSNDRLDIPPFVKVGSRKAVEGGASIIKMRIC